MLYDGRDEASFIGFQVYANIIFAPSHDYQGIPITIFSFYFNIFFFKSFLAHSYLLTTKIIQLCNTINPLLNAVGI